MALVLLAGCGRIGFSDVLAGDAAMTGDGPAIDAPPGDASTGTTLVAHTIRNGQVNMLTTAAIDTTGAALIALAECTWSTGAPVTPVDSAGNTWIPFASYGADQAPANIRMFYVTSPMTSAQHTFTDPGNDYLSIAVLAFSKHTTTVTSTGASGMVPVSPGGFTALNAGDLVATFACSGESVATAIAIDSGFQLVDTVLNGAGGAPEDMASAYVLATDPALMPKWTFTGDGKAAGVIARFR